MEVRVVLYDPSTLTDDLFQRGLSLVDPQSRQRIQRFYRREDACRCLLGRILPRLLLSERGIAQGEMQFKQTEAGKPYIASPHLDPPLAFNISHDNGMVAMGSALGRRFPPAYQVGLDIMKIRLPQRETYRNFVDTVGDQLTSLEKRILFEVPQEEGLRRFFWIWTMKEAYTKAVGLGLGFDFRRIEYNVPEEKLTIDGKAPQGWTFIKFETEDSANVYVGVAAEYVGGEETFTITSVSSDWVIKYDAVSFVNQALQTMK